MFLFAIRLLGEGIFQRGLGWPPNSKKTKDAAASLASMVHAIVLCVSLAILLATSRPYRPSGAKRKDAGSNSSMINDATTALLQFCTGYMLYDSLGMVRDNWNTGGLNDVDCLFLAHHAATSFCMITCQWIGAGQDSVLMLMLLGECTNPLGSLHSITKFAIQLEEPKTFWHTIHPYVEWLFAVSYAVVRTLIGPVVLIHIFYELLSRNGRNNVPIYISLIWLVLMWGVVLGSIPWTMETIEMARNGISAVKYGVDYDYGPRYEL